MSREYLAQQKTLCRINYLRLFWPMLLWISLYRTCAKSEVSATIAFEFFTKAIKLPTSDRMAGGDTSFLPR